MGKSVKRLVEQFAPANYRLHIDINKQSKTFKGEVVIRGKKLGRPSQRITLHQKDLVIKSANITKIDKKETTPITVDRINPHNNLHEVRLHTSEMLYPGEYEVTVAFSGTVTDPMNGLYPCYFNHNGKKKFLLATQFESHHAREVFPCIDEPSAKATFDLSLNTPASETVLSNMPAKSEEISGKHKITSFETTPIMSSYLLAFVVGEMHSVEGKTERGVLMRSWSTVAHPKKTLQHANDQAIRTIEFFESYFSTPFPLKKCDQVALPDFDAGAMENWGLITYREIALLTDPDNKSISSEHYVAMVIAHELSHQWFGNLVTMQWWDDLWLNESFAALMEHVALDKLHPEWMQWEQYVSDDVLASSNRDSYQNVQPVRVDVKHPDEIHTLFDPAIVYAKGGRLLKMLMDYIGEEAFRKGLKEYFDVHKYKNTTRDDLWTALSNASGFDVNSFMNPWLEQSGMPLITASHTGKSLHLSQRRFLLDGDDNESMWPVPLLAEGVLEKEVLNERENNYSLPSDKLPILNTHGSGHYVVHYKNGAQKELEKALEAKTINPEARINVLNDLILLNKHGELTIDTLIDVVKACKNEPRDAVWALLVRVLGLSTLLAEHEESAEAGIKKIKIAISKGRHTKLGWDDKKSDDPNTILLRHTATGLMLGGEDAKAIEDALKRYDAVSTISKLPSDLRGMILGAVVRHRGDKKDVDTLIDTYKTTPDSNLQASIAVALTHSKDLKVIKRLLVEGLGLDGFVRTQDIFRWYAYMMRNKFARALAWEWMTSSWDELEKRFGGGKSFDFFIVYSSSPIHTMDWQKKFVDFFTPKKDQLTLARNIAIAEGEIKARIEWHDRNIESLKKYFA